MAAWSEQTKQAIEADFRAPKQSPRYEPPKKNTDAAMAQAWGIFDPEPYEDFSAGGGQSNDSRLQYPSHSHKPEESPRRRDSAQRRAALPPPQPIFVPGADVDFIPPDASPPLSPGIGAGMSMKRSKSLLQRIRRMREKPNVPVANVDGDDVQTTYESGGSGYPNHKSQNSFPGRLAGGDFKEQLPSPQEEVTYVPDEAAKNKNLPRTPKINSGNPSEPNYFDQQTGTEQTGLGRKPSLMQRVGVVVRGRK